MQEVRELIFPLGADLLDGQPFVPGVDLAVARSSSQRGGLDLLLCAGAPDDAGSLAPGRLRAVPYVPLSYRPPRGCPLNGGSRAASARRRPSATQSGISASSAPAWRHSRAADLASLVLRTWDFTC